MRSLSKNEWAGVVITLFVVLILGVGTNLFINNNQPMQEGAVKVLKAEDVKVGSGAEALPGKTVVVNYKGTLENGQKFDSSYDRGQPFSFILGAGQVIQGWDRGIFGMKVGGKRTLMIPPDMGYGVDGYGPIPPNATLIFEVELIDVR